MKIAFFLEEKNIEESSLIVHVAPEHGAVGVLYLIETPQNALDFKSAPEDAYVALLAQSILAKYCSMLSSRSLRLIYLSRT